MLKHTCGKADTEINLAKLRRNSSRIISELSGGGRLLEMSQMNVRKLFVKMRPLTTFSMKDEQF